VRKMSKKLVNQILNI
jgi:hypothetical protein